LFVLTPKSLLRHPAVASTPSELAQGRFMAVLDDREARARAAKVKRLILCSGKVAVDLLTSERRAAMTNVAIVRVEQLYPFPEKSLREVLAGYPGAKDVVWLQEEPENMGAWEFMRPLLLPLLPKGATLNYIGRPRSSSPSEGSSAWHQLNQKALVDRAFDLGGEGGDPSAPPKATRDLTASKR
jgi:2-oxoglutarate dehydrogenase E1 component